MKKTASHFTTFPGGDFQRLNRRESPPGSVVILPARKTHVTPLPGGSFQRLSCYSFVGFRTSKYPLGSDIELLEETSYIVLHFPAGISSASVQNLRVFLHKLDPRWKMFFLWKTHVSFYKT